MKKQLLKRYIAYLIRWQLSTPILAPIIAYFKSSPNVLGTYEDWIGSIVANFIGGLIFFWVDKFIFYHKLKFPLWQVEENVYCVDCFKYGRGYRLVQDKTYNRINAPTPQFRCEKCSKIKYDIIKSNMI